MKKISFILIALVAFFTLSAQHRATFEDLHLAANSYWNGSNQAGGFTDGDAYFTNVWDTSYGGYWSTGFAYSNQPINADTLTALSYDYSYEYYSAPGVGALGSATYGICYIGGASTIRLQGFAAKHQVYGFYVTNTAYDYLSMKYGDHFAKKFGGATGTDPDWFRLTVTGWYQGNPIADSVQFYLADFRSPDTTQHYILKSWKFVDLLPLGNVDSLTFILNSTDTAGGFGMNTPAYFALDNFMTTDGVTYTGPKTAIDSFSFVYMDTLTGNPDTLVTNILANDSLSPFLNYSATLISSPLITGAIAFLNANDSLVYIPAAGITGVDTLYYLVCDEVGTCDTGQILVHINSPVNPTGIVDIGLADLLMYPNPALSIVTISNSTLINKLSIVDLQGRELLMSEPNRLNATINVNVLSAGIYTVVIHTYNGIATRRLVKE